MNFSGFVSIRFKTLVSLMLLVSFFAGIAYFFMVSAQEVRTQFMRHLLVETPRIIALLELKSAARVVETRIVELQALTQVNTHLENTDASVIKFGLLAATADMNRQQEQYRQYVGSDEQADLAFLDDITAAEGEIVQLSLRLFELREEGASDESIAEVTKLLFEEETAMENQIDDFVSSRIAVAEQAGRATEVTFQKIFQISTALFFFLVAFTVLVQVFISRLILPPLKRLQTAASEMAQGDLDARAGITSRDEIGQVGMAFNSMAENLKKSYVRLEEKTTEAEVNLKESERQKKDFERMNKLMVDRELRMVELKKELEQCQAALAGKSQIQTKAAGDTI